MKLWNQSIKNLFTTRDLDLLREAARNRQLQAPFQRPDGRDSIYSELENMSWSEIHEEYAKPLTLINRCKIVVIPFIPKFLLRILVKIKYCLRRETKV